MSKAVAKTEDSKAIQASQTTDDMEEILSQNIIIPRLLLMQGLSDLVAERKATMGDMVRSSTAEKLGDPTKPVDIIPLTYNNQWVLREKVGQKYEFRGTEPMTAANQDADWDFVKNGVDWKRVKTLNLYALLVKDIEAEKAEMEKAKSGETPDPEKALLPILISFQSTSFPAGKSVTTHFAKARKFGVQGYVSVLRLSCRQEKNEKGTYYVFDVATSGKTPKDYLEVADYWRALVGQNRVQVEPDESESTSGPAPVSANSKF